MTKKYKGLLLCLLMALPAWYLGKKLPIVGGPVIGLLIGIGAGFFRREKGDFAEGIAFTSKKVLQYAVILLGFGLDLKTVWLVGAGSLPIILTTIATALLTAYLLSKLLHTPEKLSILIGVGSSICGGSAIAATAPVIKAEESEIAQSISVIFLFNLLAALIFPTLGGYLGFSDSGFALFAGTAVNDTSSVTAAASAWDSIHQTGSAVLEQATIVKLTRTLAILPITMILSFYRMKKEQREDKTFSVRKIFPMFILFFLLASLCTTGMRYVLAGGAAEMFSSFVGLMKQGSRLFIVMAMTAIGLNTDFEKLMKGGLSPFLLGGGCWVAIILMSILMQKALGSF